MKLALRVFAFGIVLVGAVAANCMPKHAQFVSNQVAATRIPVPACSPNTACGIQ